MPGTRPPYSSEFRRQTVDLVRAGRYRLADGGVDHRERRLSARCPRQGQHAAWRSRLVARRAVGRGAAAPARDRARQPACRRRRARQPLDRIEPRRDHRFLERGDHPPAGIPATEEAAVKPLRDRMMHGSPGGGRPAVALGTPCLRPPAAAGRGAFAADHPQSLRAVSERPAHAQAFSIWRTSVVAGMVQSR